MSTVYLIPTVLAEGALQAVPAYVLTAIHACDVIFAENERTARRFFKLLDKSIVIDKYEWHTIDKVESTQIQQFRNAVKANKTIGIISEAGCPGIADPGQMLIAEAQKQKCAIKPLVGPSSILLALMASGFNGQQFEFVGYLPIENSLRIKKLKELELSSKKDNSTKIFIETPYRNNQLTETILQHCNSNTHLCIAANITADDEKIISKTIKEWAADKPILPKAPAIFLIYSGA